MSDTNNPRGRPKGSVNRLTQELRDAILKVDGFIDPAIFLAQIVANKDDKYPLELRLDAAKSLMPHMYPKLRQAEISMDSTITDDRDGVVWKSVPPPKPEHKDLTESEKQELDGDQK